MSGSGSRSGLATVPFPSAWTQRRPRAQWWVAPLAVLLVPLLALGGPVLVVDGQVALGVAVTASSLFLLGIAVADVRRRRWPGRRVATVGVVDGGVSFPFSSFTWRCIVAAGVGAVPFGVGVLVAVYTDPDPSSRTQTMKFVAPLLAVATVIFAGEILTRRIRRGQVLLTPEGVVHETWSDRFEVSWSDVEEVAAVDLGPRLGAGIRISMRPGRTAAHTKRAHTLKSPTLHHLPDMTVLAQQLQGDPALAAHTLAHYAAHPGARDELGNGRALDRVLDGGVVMPQLDDGGEG